MSRPLTSIERAAESRRWWYIEEEGKARSERGEKGAMEFWLRIARSQIAKEAKKEEAAGRTETLAGFALVCRFFTTALQMRVAGDRRTWDDLMTYAKGVVDRNPPRNPT